MEMQEVVTKNNENTAESEEAEKAILGAETKAKAKAESEENIRNETESE